MKMAQQSRHVRIVPPPLLLPSSVLKQPQPQPHQQQRTRHHSNTNIDSGFEKTNEHLFSILSHPISLTLASVLNDENLPVVVPPGFAKDTIETEWRRLKIAGATDHINTILASSVDLWNGHLETELMKDIYSTLTKLIAENEIKGFRIIDTKNQKIECRRYEWQRPIVHGRTSHRRI